MNCENCGHTHLVHRFKEAVGGDSQSLFEGGKCIIDGCGCTNYADKIELIDEELM